MPVKCTRTRCRSHVLQQYSSNSASAVSLMAPIARQVRWYNRGGGVTLGAPNSSEAGAVCLTLRNIVSVWVRAWGFESESASLWFWAHYSADEPWDASLVCTNLCLFVHWTSLVSECLMDFTSRRSHGDCLPFQLLLFQLSASLPSLLSSHVLERHGGCM